MIGPDAIASSTADQSGGASAVLVQFVLVFTIAKS
jgi:hypothetical protein